MSFVTVLPVIAHAFEIKICEASFSRKMCTFAPELI